MSEFLKSVDRLATLSEKAAPSPWKLWGMEVMHDTGSGDVKDAIPIADTFSHDPDQPLRTFNAQFIAESRSIIPGLLQAIRRVVDLHAPICEHSGVNCKSPTCPLLVCQNCGDDYPCSTRKALEEP